MAWTPRTSRSGVEYGGSASSFYWNSNLNPNARFTDCLPNCTTYAYGRQLEQGRPKPVTSIINAGSWKSVVNERQGWRYIEPFNLHNLSVGDIVEWAGHLAVIEAIIGGVPYISNSVYTGDNGRAYDPPDSTHFSPRTPSVIGGSTLQDVSNWAINNYPSRFFSYSSLASCPWVSGNPIGYLHYVGEEGELPVIEINQSSTQIVVDEQTKTGKTRIDITCTKIPVTEDVDGLYRTQSEGIDREWITSGWTISTYSESGKQYKKIEGSMYIVATDTTPTPASVTFFREFNIGYVSKTINFDIVIEQKTKKVVLFLNPSIGSIDIR